MGLCAFVMGWMLTFDLRATTPSPIGLPFIRTYSLDEIGDVPRTLRLGFDEFGRVAAMYDGVYSVLNDSAWVNRIDRNAASRVRMTRIVYHNGTYYYGGRGSWGRVERTMDGHFTADPLVPSDAPEWTRVSAFNIVLPTDQGVYFPDLNGVVYWDFASRKNQFFALPRMVSAFTIGERVFVSCEDNQLREVLPRENTMRVVALPALEGQAVTTAAPLDAGHTLLALRNGKLLVFDGETLQPWRSDANAQIQGGITNMQSLLDGGMAIAVANQGVYLFSPQGALRWFLRVSEFQRVTEMAAGEPGVLWVAGKNAVHRVYFNSPITSFGLQDGLTMTWPYVTKWKNDVVVAAAGQLYISGPQTPGAPPSLQRMNITPARLGYQAAGSGDHLLVGNATEVFAVYPGHVTKQVISIQNVAALEFMDENTCVVIGSQEIAALRYIDGQWVECAPRIPGVGDAPTRYHHSRKIWIEMGGDRLAYLALEGNQLVMKRLTLPWNETQWTNVGEINGTIVISGATGRRAYFDEVSETFQPRPELDALLARSPYWISRVKQAPNGVIWASHPLGVVTFTPKGNDYSIDATTFELRNDSYPAVTFLPDNQVWLSSGRALYHVEPSALGTSRPVSTVLVSLIADQQGLELLTPTRPDRTPDFAYENNSLSFRFFSGTYAWRSPPRYEYRLSTRESWTPMDPSLVLRFPKLRDGHYLLEVRNVQPGVTPSSPLSFGFVINPPWYRAPASYAAYSVLLALAVIGLARWINHRSLRHNAELQTLVHARTKELEDAMVQLGEKSRNEATMAERSRLAGEIHDSMQQGLSGSILHLDTTMNHPSIPPDVHAKLAVVRNMLAYSREEVQQAVWNLESPLLQNSNLGDALRKIAGYISCGSMAIEVTAPKDPVPLAPATRHHLLRIAQEAITNAVKHAQTAHIHVTLENQPGAVVLKVKDDGKGFDPVKSAQAEGHFGLRGLRSRARAIRADLKLLSSPGAGTTICVTVPTLTPSHA